MKKTITKTISVTGRFIAYVEKEYKITLELDIDEEEFNENFNGNIDNYIDEYHLEDFESESEGKFTKDVDNGKLEPHHDDFEFEDIEDVYVLD